LIDADVDSSVFSHDCVCPQIIVVISYLARQLCVGGWRLVVFVRGLIVMVGIVALMLVVIFCAVPV
jgi:hypothetical protein